MPKSCLLVFPHSERKRQNNPFQIGTFHFRFFFSSLPLRFNISYLPTFFPKQVYLYGVLSKNSVNRYWVAMALSHRKRPRQFVSSYSFERVAVLGRIILFLSLRLRSGCAGPPGYTMLYTCLPLVFTCVPLVSYSPACRVMCLMCLNSTQQHWTGRDKKQRPSKERDQLQQTSTSSTCPKKRARGRQEHQPKIPKSNQRRAGKGKGPGNLSLEKRDQKRDQNEMHTRS